MVNPEPRRKSATPNRDRKADDIVGVDEIVRVGIEIELREHATGDAELDAVAGLRPAHPRQPENIADAHRSDIQVAVIARLANVADERTLPLGIGYDRTEH